MSTVVVIRTGKGYDTLQWLQSDVFVAPLGVYRVVRPWLSAVYARAAADQAMEMLTSHAAAMTASLQ